jgi:hypothetical protein
MARAKRLKTKTAADAGRQHGYSPNWENGDQPWLRQQGRLSPIPCPFCGGSTLLLSDRDLADDDLRVEVYCTNINCAAREIVILATRTNLAPRADQMALERVDDGKDMLKTPRCVDNRTLFDHGWSATELIEHYRDGRIMMRRRGENDDCTCGHCRRTKQ